VVKLTIPRGPHGPRGGFSLVGLALTLALVTIAAAIAIPAFFERSEVSLENAAVLLAKDLRSAQNRAAYLACEVRVNFREDGDGYWVEDLPTKSGRIGSRPVSRIYSDDAVFEGVQIESVELERGETLLYRPRGIASTAARITLSFRGDRRVVTVADDTGRLAIEGSIGDWVDRGF
jgi:Tfp pilus assembly protein FimT